MKNRKKILTKADVFDISSLLTSFSRVLINVYFRGNVVQTPPDENAPADPNMVSIGEFDTYFRRGVANANPNADNSLIRIFRDRRALAIESVNNDINGFSMTEMNALPFGRTDRGGDPLSPDDDPTLRAVFINSYVGK